MAAASWALALRNASAMKARSNGLIVYLNIFTLMLIYNVYVELFVSFLFLDHMIIYFDNIYIYLYQHIKNKNETLF